MDILIKNMEMPKDDNEQIIIKSDGSCRRERFSNNCILKIESSQAVALPEHGRLIDADKEIESYEQTKTAMKECGQKRCFAFKEACHAIEVLKDAPTIAEASNG